MDLREIPVEYCDDGAVWSLFSSNITKRLPLRGVRYRDLEGTVVTVGEVAVHFTQQVSRSYTETDSNLHLKPYLAIYILHCTELETYRSLCRPLLKSWIESMDAGKQEWMVLYIPALTMISESQNKTYMKIYDKLKDELGAITGIRKDRCTRFYSSTKKRYVSIDQPSAHSDEFWKDAIHSISDFIGQSIESRIATLKEKALLYEEQMRSGQNSFYSYCLVCEGLAFLYTVLDQLTQAFNCYEEIMRFMDSSGGFGRKHPVRDLQGTMEQGLGRYQERLIQDTISDLEFLEYVMAREKKLLSSLDMTLFLGQKFLQFLLKGPKLLKSYDASMEEKAAWITTMSIYAITSIKKEAPSKTYLELKIPAEQSNLQYIMGHLYTIIQCQIILKGDVVQWEEIVVRTRQPSTGFLPGIEMLSSKLFTSGREKVSIDPVVFNSGDTTPSQFQLDDTNASIDAGKEDYLEEIMKNIIIAFQECNYPRKALFYQAQFAVLCKKFGRMEDAASLLTSIIPVFDHWKAIQLSLELQLLDCLLQLKRPREAFEVAVKICSKGTDIVTSEVANPLSERILELVHNPYLREELVLSDSKMMDVEVTLPQWKYTVGEKVTLLVRLTSRLSTPIVHIDRLQVSLIGIDSHNSDSDKVIFFAVNDVDAGPVTSTVVLEAKAEAVGIFRFRRTVCHIGRLKLTTELTDTGKLILEADHKDVLMQAKIPSFLVYGHLQSFVVEVKNLRGNTTDARLSWLPMKALRLESWIQCMLSKGDSVITSNLAIDRNTISLPGMDPGCTCTLQFNVRLDEEDEEPEGEDSDLTVHSPDRPSNCDRSVEVIASTSQPEYSYPAGLSCKCSRDTFTTSLNYTDGQGTVVVIPERVNLLFVDPLVIAGRLVSAGKQTLLTVRLENRCHISLQVFQWNLFGCQSSDINDCPVTLRSGQETHLAFQVSELEPSITIECRYKAVYRVPAVIRPAHDFAEKVRQHVFYKRGKIAVPSSNATALKVLQVSPRRLSLFSDEEVNLGDDEVEVKEAN